MIQNDKADMLQAVTDVANPAVTVIALCFNHARFLHQCLNSIAAQTHQDFQLIVTDDCSKDNSAELIRKWLEENRPNAIFIAHPKNEGLCRTLNKAIGLAKGEFISMIATDDDWEPEKIERQLTEMRAQGPDVAVVYSDAARMDEDGARLEKNFIDAHTPECTRPSGQVFSELANRNFIPAMATLIRRQAIIDVGGYDESLSYEDYDMWLRLADRYSFVYCDAVLARYRIVATSLVRTVFIKPTANHYLTLCLICHKWLPSGQLSQAQYRAWVQRLEGAAYGLYVLNDSRAKVWLWRAARFSLKLSSLLRASTYSLGITRQLAKRLTHASD